MSCEERCEPFEHAFRRPASCTSTEGPCTPIRRPQTPCMDLPGGKYITMEDPTKKSCHLRPSLVALCQDFSLEWALSAHRWGRSNAAKQCKNGCGMTQESATQWNHAPQTCYPHPLERTQRLGPRGMAITGSCYNVLVKSSKKKGRETKGYSRTRGANTSCTSSSGDWTRTPLLRALLCELSPIPG